MIKSLRGAAHLHRRIFEQFVEEVGVSVLVRQPAIKTGGTGVDRVLGKRADVTTIGSTRPCQVVWSTDLFAISRAPTDGTIPNAIAALATIQECDAVLRGKLSDALINPADKFGQTIFDTAHDIVYGGHSWRVTGTAQTGLAPESPYALWVAVVKVGD
jgi:hypothetical protein